jgi:hypothetical protein
VAEILAAKPFRASSIGSFAQGGVEKVKFAGGFRTAARSRRSFFGLRKMVESRVPGVEKLKAARILSFSTGTIDLPHAFR